MSFCDGLQSFFEPHGKLVVSDISTGHSRHDICQRQIVDHQSVSASDCEQFHQIDSRALVAVHKAMIRHDAVNQCGRFLVDARVVAVIRPGYRRLDG